MKIELLRNGSHIQNQVHSAKILVFLLLFTFFHAQSQNISDFRFTAAAISWENDFIGIIDHGNRTITFTTQKWIKDIAQLPATFVLDGNYEVRVAGNVQVNGITANDFRKDVVYTVNGNVEYTVKFISPQASGLPVIKIDVESGAEVATSEDYQNMSFALTDPHNSANNISKTDMTDRIRGRGHSTWWGVYKADGEVVKDWIPDKRPYRISFDQKTSLFGLPAARAWVLLANWYDPTLLKTTFAFELAERLGLRYNHTYHHVELYLNGTYRGSYILTEQNQVNKGRVDIHETEGWLVKLDFHSLREVGPKFQTTNYDLPVMIESPEFEPADISNPAFDFVRNDLEQLCDLMASADFPENGYRDLIDMESMVKYFMVATITGFGDFTNPGSVYFYKDKGGKICGGPPWDFDINFGFSWTNDPVYKINSPNANYPADRRPFPGSTSNPRRQFFLRFSEDPVFVARWREVWNNNFAQITSMSQFIDDMAVTIRKSAIENFKVTWLDYPVDFDHWIGELKKFLTTRLDYLDQQYKEPMLFPGNINFGTEIVGYSEIPAQTIRMIGKTSDMRDLHTAQLEEDNRSDFEISLNLTPTDIGNGESAASVSIKPKKSLPAGDYYASVAFYYGDKYKTAPLMFTVFQPAVNDATLKSLTVSSGRLSPAFDANVTEYIVTVDNNVTNITVTGVATNYIDAKVSGNVTNHSLDVGENKINITVTAEDGITTKTYSVTVIRAVFIESKKIYVNEISGNNKWLELYNDENEAINLSGYSIQSIQNDGTVSTWTIPFGTTIAAKGYKVWTQNVDDGFTWGISAQRDVAFKLFDDKRRELDFFEVKMSNNLYSQGGNRTVGRQTDGHPNLILFLEDGTKGYSNNLGTPEPSPPTYEADPFASVLTVYPNPFMGEIHLKGAEGSILQVFGMDGAAVHTQMITNPDEIIKLDNLPSGMYVLKVIKNGKSVSVKVIKNQK